MKRRELSNGELNKVILMRQNRLSWLKIQKETGIDRRIAKRAYFYNQQSKSMEELKDARTGVAAQALRGHIDSLIRLAASLVTNLDVSISIADMEKNSEQFFSWLWQQDLLQRYISGDIEFDAYTMGATQRFHIGDQQTYRREKELLFESLKIHTRENVQWKDILDNRWKMARDDCANIVPELRRDTKQVISNYLKQEQQISLLQKIKEESREDDPAEHMVKGVLTNIWRLIFLDKLDKKDPWFQKVLQEKGTPQNTDIYVKSEDDTILRFIGKTNINLADTVARICNRATDNLRAGDIVPQLRLDIGIMKSASEELREALNPVKLQPILLRTRCDLCPA